MDTVVFAALIWQVIDFLKELANLPGSRSAVVTQATAWIAGIALAFVGAHAQIAQGLVLPGTDSTLGSLDWGSLVLVGLLLSSTASTGVDFKQAFDRSDSNVKPALLPEQVPVQETPVPVVPTTMATGTETPVDTTGTTMGGPTTSAATPRGKGGKG